MHQSFPYNSLGLDILQHFKIRNKQTKKNQGSKTYFPKFFVCSFNKSYPGCPIFCVCLLLFFNTNFSGCSVRKEL